MRQQPTAPAPIDDVRVHYFEPLRQQHRNRVTGFFAMALRRSADRQLIAGHPERHERACERLAVDRPDFDQSRLPKNSAEQHDDVRQPLWPATSAASRETVCSKLAGEQSVADGDERFIDPRIVTWRFNARSASVSASLCRMSARRSEHVVERDHPARRRLQAALVVGAVVVLVGVDEDKSSYRDHRCAERISVCSRGQCAGRSSPRRPLL